MQRQRDAVGPRVFIHYPAGVRSGGPEALYQLCDALISSGVEAMLVPLEGKSGTDDTSDYGRYESAYSSTVPDAEDVIVVLPEIAISHARLFSRARVVIWWLSVDFAEPYLHRLAVARGERSRSGRVAHLVHVAAPWRPELRAGAVRALLPTLSHCAQSTYAVSYLYAHEGVVANDLSDYIQSAGDHADDTTTSRPRVPGSVAYNPAKGRDYLQALRDLAPELTWRPVQGLSREQVVEMLGEVEVYIDLGHHPGRDRIPREAALSGCVVVVARRGSAAFPQDMPIQDSLRIRISPSVGETAEQARKVLDTVLADPEPWRRGQDEYRRQIRGQEAVFRREVRRIFVEGELVAPTSRH